MAKDFLKTFKRDTFQEMRDQGLLRDPRQYSLMTHFLPALTNQANAEINRDKEFNEGVDGYTMSTLRGNARTHKEAIAKEYQRIEDK